MFGFYEIPDKFLEEAAVAESQQISAHLLTYCECKLNTIPRKKKKTSNFQWQEKRALPHSFPMTLKFCIAKIKRAHFKWLPVPIWNCSSFLFLFQKIQLLAPAHTNTAVFRSCSFDTRTVLTCHLVDQQHPPIKHTWNPCPAAPLSADAMLW